MGFDDLDVNKGQPQMYQMMTTWISWCTQLNWRYRLMRPDLAMDEQINLIFNSTIIDGVSHILLRDNPLTKQMQYRDTWAMSQPMYWNARDPPAGKLTVGLETHHEYIVDYAPIEAVTCRTLRLVESPAWSVRDIPETYPSTSSS